MAQTLAEKARQHKLADAVLALSQSASVLPADMRPVATPQATSNVRSTRRSLPPLFKPGETDAVGDEAAAGAPAATTAAEVNVNTEPAPPAPAPQPVVKSEPPAIK